MRLCLAARKGRVMQRKTITLLILAAAAAAALSGCGDYKELEQKSSKVEYSGSDVYPVKCDDTLKVWSSTLPGGDITQNPLGSIWQEETGVNVEFIQPMNGSEEALTILLASGDLPDILLTNLYNQPGGVKKYVDDEVIIPITDYMDKFAPNLKKYLDENKDIDKMSKSDDGEYFSFPFLRGDEKLTVSSGLAVRKDMLDKAGLDIPETIDEWHTVLQAFKSQGVSAPLSYDLLYWEKYAGVFMGAYGTKADFYLKDGKVTYGYLEPEFKEGLKTLNQWYSEGLIDKNIVKIADKDANILNSVTGASCMWAGSGLGKYMNAMKDKNPSFDLEPAPFPVLKKGDTSKFGTKEFAYNINNNGFITTSCKNIELAMRFLDYGYTEKGHMMMNFGKEGESYKMEGDYPKYTDWIMNNPDGLSISDAIGKYTLASTSGPFVQDVRYIEQYYALPQQKTALDVWQSDIYDTHIPMVSLTAEESSRISSIMNDVETCADEMIFKFIMGIEPLDNYDSFINTIKGFGVDEAIQIYSDAVERYNKR